MIKRRSTHARVPNRLSPSVNGWRRGAGSRVLAETRSSSEGAWSLPVLDGGALLEASADGVAQWLPLQALKRDLTLELQPTIDAVVRVTAPEGTRGIAVTDVPREGELVLRRR